MLGNAEDRLATLVVRLRYQKMTHGAVPVNLLVTHTAGASPSVIVNCVNRPKAADINTADYEPLNCGFCRSLVTI